MLVWLNGPFGGGKTQTAYELQRRCPGSVVCDPEFVGFGLHRMLPRSLRTDFQDLRSWRAGVVEVLDVALRSVPGPVLAPMTVVEPVHFDETVGELRRLGHDVAHFALLAERDTVLRRLRERGIGRVLSRVCGDRSALTRPTFALRMLDRCLEALQGAEFAEHVCTDRRSVAEVADHVAASCGLVLQPPDGRVRARARRVSVGLRHIRTT